uniref:Uncharacterized protein n=1 Tax=Chromera velia CCMP2878 TaxID=1169474 RepID=A0A0G4I5M0_9ALVE|eukprot:Cvel_11216.t1-p1 / transcript=Cvel_11216.t1 / gene=Cvel_11216 / organism=Chromera_velia_CCMP2878 / gene_product=hypothetical protein / transcript_product=hypothetical protein / location=Cvel_scaffold697:66249-70644(+) / protein_length=987 / sequence_SO=supercontig / SO=protein_coding / is_pseudo=false
MQQQQQQQIAQRGAQGTQVEPAEEFQKQSREKTESSGGPILRLRVDPSTGKVVTADQQNDGGSASGHGRVPDAFVMRQEEGAAVVQEHEEYVEVHDSNEHGLSWGERRANDGSWAERWMQQESGAGEGRAVFGRRTGFDVSRQHAWTERWTRRDGVLRVHREVQRVDEHGEVLEEWEERVVQHEAGAAVVSGREKNRASPGVERDTKTVVVPPLPRGSDNLPPVDSDPGVATCSSSSSSSSSSAFRPIPPATNGKAPPERPCVAAAVHSGSDAVELDEPGWPTQIFKRGRNYETGREWVETVRQRPVEVETPAHAAASSHLPNSPQSPAARLEESQREFEERLDGFVRGRRVWQGHDGSSRNEVYVRQETGEDGSGGEEWHDVWQVSPDGERWGTKRGVNSKGERWHERWFQQPRGRQEVDKWAETADGKRRWGEKTGVGDNQEEYNERWEKTHDKRHHQVTLDKWWRHKDKGEWGEKSRDLVALVDDSAAAEEGANGSAAGQRLPQTFVEEVKEKWYDNGREREVDKWATETTWDGAPPAVSAPVENGSVSVPPLPAQLREHKPDEMRLFVRRRGEKRGNRTDGTEWGERWQFDEGPRDGPLPPSDETSPPPSSSAAASTEASRGDPNTPLGSAGPSGLRVTLRFSDKWWKERTGNRWGEKSRESDVDGTVTEKWYDNGWEKQVDRWRRGPDGESSGEKFGDKIDGTTWHERWGKKAGAGDGSETATEWIDKSWCKHEEGRQFKWGEKSRKEGGRLWSEKWSKREETGGAEGDEWCEIWGKDAEGNTQTERRGNQWRVGLDGQREVVDWFQDKFGEHGKEKWAFKQGANSEGDEWMEKWNERGMEKSAEKRGKNARGDEWREQWKENLTQRGKFTWAEKEGKNAQGEQWLETWVEESENKKKAKKTASNAQGEHWEEEWGEDLRYDGSGEKWTSKWASDSQGRKWGNNWGDKWGKGGKGGHRWVEYWEGDHVDKWAGDTEGRPPGC